MRSMIAAAHSTAAGPIAVVTGGFHTAALLFPPDGEASFEPPEATSQVWLTRYDFRALDRLNGYAAGLPLPGFYDRLWQRLTSQKGETPLAEQVFTGFRAHLAANAPTLAFSFPTLRSMVETARRLAALRDLAEPGRVELFDALQSAGIKDEIEAGHAPLLAAFTSYLQGERLGDLPAGSRLPPLVERRVETGFRSPTRCPRNANSTSTGSLGIAKPHDSSTPCGSSLLLSRSV
jgi:hypothetical protein